jgi:hypothetical protein
MRRHSILLVSCLIVALGGCSKSKTPQSRADTQQANTTIINAESSKGRVDACALLTSKEIESVQGEPLKETKSSGKSEGGFVVSQCFFTLPTFTNSISLTVMQRGDSSNARDPKEFWKETFHRDKDKDKERAEEEGKSAAPEKIPDLGDESFWTGNRFGGALYVLKGNSYIRIAIGGSGDQTSKLKKTRALAEMLLKRL